MSINLHAAVRPLISALNSDYIGTIYASNGYTIDTDGAQIPSYTKTPNVTIQEQALSAREIEHLDSLNIQGVMRGFWLYGIVQGINRPEIKGGDWIISPAPEVFKVVHVFETWRGPGWSHVAGALQMADNAPGGL